MQIGHAPLYVDECPDDNHLRLQSTRVEAVAVPHNSYDNPSAASLSSTTTHAYSDGSYNAVGNGGQHGNEDDFAGYPGK